MKVCILGCARSGTTAVYVLLQQILEERYGAVDYFYEPFLWDHHVFNRKYEEAARHFKYVDSLSFEGIYHHLMLPLFIEEPSPYQSNPYLDRLFSTDIAGKSKLLKFIRANGRYLLLQRISPDTRFIFITRNPADTANSVARLFSFYGGEFHRDDFPRFLEEINRIYKTGVKKGDVKIQAEKELLYWHYMNRFALESFEKAVEKPLILCHEEILADPRGFVEKLCRFLEIPPRGHYIEKSRELVGYNTRRVDISRKEFDLYTRYLDIYQQLLKDHHIDYPVDKNKILDKYEVIDNKPPRRRTLYGLTSLKLLRKYEKIKAELEAKTRQCNQKEKMLSQQIDRLGHEIDPVPQSYSRKIGRSLGRISRFLSGWILLKKKKRK
jgi:hypothetical protein